MVFQKRTRWKRQDFLSKKEKPAAWLKDAKDMTKNLTTLKIFEVLFGNKFERIRQKTQTYTQRRTRNKLTFSLFEVKYILGVLVLSGFHRLISNKSYCE